MARAAAIRQAVVNPVAAASPVAGNPVG